jgi:lipopolysaccharide export system protein LptC
LRALLPLLLVASACRPVHPPMVDLPPEVILYGVQIQHFKGDQIAAAGHANRLTYERWTADFIAYGDVMRFPSREGSAAQGGMEVRAPVVQGNLAARRADGTGGVVMRTGSGMVGETDRAHFDGVALTASGDVPVKLRGPEYRLEADAFLFHLKTEEFSFIHATTWFGAPK